MQRPLLHLNWTLEQEWLQPASSLLSPQSLSVPQDFNFSYLTVLKIKPPGRWMMPQKMITVITAPVDVDAASVGAGELSQREASRVGWSGVEREFVKNYTRCHLTRKSVLFDKKKHNEGAVKTDHRSLVHLSDLHSRHPGHMSMRWGCSAHWHRGIGLVGMCELAGGQRVKWFSAAKVLLPWEVHHPSSQQLITVKDKLKDLSLLQKVLKTSCNPKTAQSRYLN